MIARIEKCFVCAVLCASVFFMIAGGSPARAQGCYDELIGTSVTAPLGRRVEALKNKKWNCKPLNFIYAGKLSKTTFSLAVQYSNGAMNLFFPVRPSQGRILVDGHEFSVLEVHEDEVTLVYLGERKAAVKEGAKEE